MRLVILADDFTGAMDTAVRFSKCNIPTYVFVRHEPVLESWPEEAGEHEVVVVNMNCRHMHKDRVYDMVCALWRRLSLNRCHLYIKTDSALRGNIEAAYEAVRDMCQKPILFVPAFPESGRTTVDGKQYVNGSLLEESVFARDPRNPMTNSQVAAIINTRGSLKIKQVSMDGLSEFKDGSGYDVIVFDCDSQEHMVKIGAALKERSLLSVTSGCAGFAAVLPGLLPLTLREPQALKVRESTLVFCGTANAVSFAQLERARHSGARLFMVTPVMLISEDWSGLLEQLAQEAVRQMASGVPFIVCTAEKEEDIQWSNAFWQQTGMSRDGLHHRIYRFFSLLSASLMDRYAVGTLGIIGGDMCEAVLDGLKISHVVAQNEIEAGIPVSMASYKGRPFRLITKSGGLGSQEAIINMTQIEGEQV